MHLMEMRLLAEKYPTTRHYPFNLKILQETGRLGFNTPVTFLVGENGTGKSTLLRALCRKCGIHIWETERGGRMESNPSENFRNFAEYVEEWGKADPDSLKYFGGKSLITQSHGQSMMTFFRARYQIKGLYFLDEPETALSPRSQLELVRLLREMGDAGHAQFIVATHSPILLACPGATIYSLDHIPVKPIDYEETQYYRIFKDFLENREEYL
ncbi:MAG: AAA family ATPase [Desulfobacteraceae bacterium 4572_87]|nr:MAG: AAA family ATPase [Desulfobacteraceae bacterium 4572_87]